MTSDSFTPVTDHTKDRIWEEMFDLQRYIQYYSMQSNRLSFLSKLLRVLQVGWSRLGCRFGVSGFASGSGCWRRGNYTGIDRYRLRL